jgi:cephalosporin hydroxylase
MGKSEKNRADRSERDFTDSELHRVAEEFMRESVIPKYSYNFDWLGRAIIQYPQDMVAVQEIIWTIKPDLIIETGIAHGGSLMLSASMLAILDMCEAIECGTTFNPISSQRKVLGVDIDIRPHNRLAIEAHPMFCRISMIEGSSIAPDVVEEVQKTASLYECILVLLDSHHTHDHVLAELNAYAPLTSVGSYCVVFDTTECLYLPDHMGPDKLWGPRNNPKTALMQYLDAHHEFQVDHQIDNKLLISGAKNGYLRRIS